MNKLLLLILSSLFINANVYSFFGSKLKIELRCLDSSSRDHSDIGKTIKLKILNDDQIDMSYFDDIYSENPELISRCIHSLYFDELYKKACGYEANCIRGVISSLVEYMKKKGMPLTYQENLAHIDGFKNGLSANQAEKSLTEDELDNLEQSLRANCGREDENMKYLDPTFLASRLVGILNSVIPECKSRIETELASDLSYYTSRMPEVRTEEQYHTIANQLTKAIVEANSWIEQVDSIRDFKDEILCEENIHIKTVNLPQLITGIQESFSCAIQKEGRAGERTIDFDNGERLTRREQELYKSSYRVEEKYSLYRSGQVFYAGLNVNFVSDPPQMAAEMREKAKSCFKEAAPFLNGNAGMNQQEYNIKLVFPEDYPGEDTPPATSVKVSNIGRSNSTEWNKDVPCSTIIHESLHLMGLCDEYAETAQGYSYNPEDDSYQFSANGKDSDGNSLPNFRTVFDCRALGPTDSIMSNHHQAWRNSIERGKSLLSPAHFNAIIFPGCNRVNGNYYRCAKNAYITTSEVAGDRGDMCRSKPPECSEGNTKWITN